MLQSKIHVKFSLTNQTLPHQRSVILFTRAVCHATVIQYLLHMKHKHARVHSDILADFFFRSNVLSTSGIPRNSRFDMKLLKFGFILKLWYTAYDLDSTSHEHILKTSRNLHELTAKTEQNLVKVKVPRCKQYVIMHSEGNGSLGKSL